MRLAPVPMFFHRDAEEAVRMCGESSRTTHGAEECVDACRLFGGMILTALDGGSKDTILFGAHGEHGGERQLAESIAAIGAGGYRDKPETAIKGSGYVVESLEAALWCFYRSTSFEEAILTAANLGDDADTTAAICGQIAGAYYGEDTIPPSWRAKLAERELIVELADRLLAGRI